MVERQTLSEDYIGLNKNGGITLAKPLVAVTMGDPAGIGPEVVAKAMDWVLGRPHGYQPVMVGSQAVMKKTFKDLGLKREILTLSDISEVSELGPDELSSALILDASAITPRDFPMGKSTREAGQAAIESMNMASQLALSAAVQATVSAPGNADSRRLAADTPAAKEAAKRQKAMASISEDDTSMMLMSRSLRVAHVTEHVSLKQACEYVTKDHVLSKLKLVDPFLKNIGLRRRKIAVAGLNPHATGEEETNELIPAVEAARKMGLDVEGPLPPDTVVFRAASGEFDTVLVMYHDQGHSPVKMYGFKRGVISITLGRPFPQMSVAHGTAFDIAGKGIANPGAMRQAIDVAGKFAIGLQAKRISNHK